MLPILQKVLDTVRNHKTIEDTITYLKELGYKFISKEAFKDYYPTYEVKPQHKHYEFLIREGDMRLSFAIKMYGNKRDKLQVYFQQKHLETIHKPWFDSKDINFKKMEIRWAFPSYMSHQQRRDWRAEHKKLQNFPKKYKPSEYYLACAPDIVYLEIPKIA